MFGWAFDHAISLASWGKLALSIRVNGLSKSHLHKASDWLLPSMKVGVYENEFSNVRVSFDEVLKENLVNFRSDVVSVHAQNS